MSFDWTMLDIFAQSETLRTPIGKKYASKCGILMTILVIVITLAFALNEIFLIGEEFRV